MLTFSVEEVFVVRWPLVEALYEVGGGGVVWTEPRPPVGAGLLQQTEAPGLSGRVCGHSRPLPGVLHPPQLARLPGQGDQGLLLASNLVPEIRTTEKKKILIFLIKLQIREVLLNE